MSEYNINKDSLDLIKLSIKFVETTHEAVKDIEAVSSKIVDPDDKKVLEEAKTRLITASGEQIKKVLEILNKIDS
jgi:hypothetical protein